MLSSRLQFIYEQLQPGLDVWDLCCDHGYLGIVALKSRRFQKIHFVDQAAHLVEALRARWSAEPEARFYPGPAEGLTDALEGNLVLAGVGANKILTILKCLELKGALRAQRLILVPHKDEEQLASELVAGVFGNYRLDQSLSVQEGTRVRRVFVLNSLNDSRVV